MNRQTRTIILTIIATLLVIVVLQNMRNVAVRFILWDSSVPFALLMIVTFVGGLLAGMFWRRR